jgi:hypothetical protein
MRDLREVFLLVISFFAISFLLILAIASSSSIERHVQAWRSEELLTLPKKEAPSHASNLLPMSTVMYSLLEYIIPKADFENPIITFLVIVNSLLFYYLLACIAVRFVYQEKKKKWKRRKKKK